MNSSKDNLQDQVDDNEKKIANLINASDFGLTDAIIVEGVAGENYRLLTIKGHDTIDNLEFVSFGKAMVGFIKKYRVSAPNESVLPEWSTLAKPSEEWKELLSALLETVKDVSLG
jgi:hypothetical protein